MNYLSIGAVGLITSMCKLLSASKLSKSKVNLRKNVWH